MQHPNKKTPTITLSLSFSRWNVGNGAIRRRYGHSYGGPMDVLATKEEIVSRRCGCCFVHTWNYHTHVPGTVDAGPVFSPVILFPRGSQFGLITNSISNES